MNGAPPTIYDVAAIAGVSIASVSRVLNGTGRPRPETRDRVLRAVAELGFVPDGAARALSVKLKETVGVVYRRVPKATSGAVFAEEDENLQFADIINRGIEIAAQRRGFSLLISSVAAEDADAGRRMMALAGKCDGLIVHDLVLDAAQLDRLGRHIPVVDLAGITTPHTASVRGDSETGMRALMRHLIRDHGYTTLGYLAGVADSPDNVTRRAVVEAEARAGGAELAAGPEWQGSYYADGGAHVIDGLLSARPAAAPGHRLRQRPRRARGRAHAGPPRRGRARRRGGHRVRRHPGRAAAPSGADHRPPAHPGARGHRVRAAGVAGRQRPAGAARCGPADPADPPAELRLLTGSPAGLRPLTGSGIPEHGQ